MPHNGISASEGRLLPLDALRGLILVLMAVDHASYFVARLHPTGEFWGIPLPAYDSMGAFLTRVITHLCAPGFFFLLGIGMVMLQQSRTRLGWSRARITRFFLTRGVVLILLQFGMENSSWLMGPADSLQPPGGGDQVWIHFGVLSALGMAMILGALLLYLRWGFVLGLSVAALFLTWLVIPDPGSADHLCSPLVRILVIPGRTGMLQVFYCFLPWAGVAGHGALRATESCKDRRGLLKCGGKGGRSGRAGPDGSLDIDEAVDGTVLLAEIVEQCFTVGQLEPEIKRAEHQDVQCVTLGHDSPLTVGQLSHPCCARPPANPPQSLPPVPRRATDAICNAF